MTTATRTAPSPRAQALRTALDPEVVDLVTTHLPLAQYAVNAVAARTQLPGHVSREDLVSCARLALVEAARRYDPSVGASFATYAHPRLQGAVLDELRSADWASRGVRSAARRAQVVADALAADLGRFPTTAEVATRLGVEPVELHALHVDVHRALMMSIDDNPNADQVPTRAEDPERALLRAERVTLLHDAIGSLPDRLGEVVQRAFFEDESLTSIAADLGVTLSRVSQMRAQALRMLHAAMGGVMDGPPVPESGGSRARAQQRAYLAQVATRSQDYRSRLGAPAGAARSALGATAGLRASAPLSA